MPIPPFQVCSTLRNRCMSHAIWKNLYSKHISGDNKEINQLQIKQIGWKKIFITELRKKKEQEKGIDWDNL